MADEKNQNNTTLDDLRVQLEKMSLRELNRLAGEVIDSKEEKTKDANKWFIRKFETVKAEISKDKKEFMPHFEGMRSSTKQHRVTATDLKTADMDISFRVDDPDNPNFELLVNIPINYTYQKKK